MGGVGMRTPSGSPSVPGVGEECVSLVNLVLHRQGGPWFSFLVGQKGQGLGPGGQGDGEGHCLCSRVLGPGIPTWNPSPLACGFPTIMTVSALQECPAPVSWM